MNFKLDVVSISGNIFSGEVERVTIPTFEGEATVLARHMPFVAPLTVGEVIVKTPEKLLNFSIGKGIFSIKGNSASLLIEDVTSADEISEEKVLEAKKKAEELIAKGISGEEKLQAMYALRKSLIDLKIARKRRKIQV